MRRLIDLELLNKTVPEDCLTCIISVVLAEKYPSATFAVSPFNGQWGTIFVNGGNKVPMTKEQSEIAIKFDCGLNVRGETLEFTERQIELIEYYLKGRK